MAITEKNTLIEVQMPNGDVERQYPITKAENVLGLSKITGVLTEKHQKALMLLAMNSYIVDEKTGEVYKIGAYDGKLHFEKSDVDIRDLIEIVEDAIGENSKENKTE